MTKFKAFPKMKKIKLTQKQIAVIDDEDFDWLNQWKWFYNNQGYAVRSKYIRSSGYGKKDGKGATHCEKWRI